MAELEYNEDGTLKNTLHNHAHANIFKLAKEFYGYKTIWQWLDWNLLKESLQVVFIGLPLFIILFPLIPLIHAIDQKIHAKKSLKVFEKI